MISQTARQTGGQMKTWETTIKVNLEPLSGLRVFGNARWGKDWIEVSGELAQDRRAWRASTRDVVNSIGDVGSTRLRWMPTHDQEEDTNVVSNQGWLGCIGKFCRMTRPNLDWSRHRGCWDNGFALLFLPVCPTHIYWWLIRDCYILIVLELRRSRSISKRWGQSALALRVKVSKQEMFYGMSHH